MNFKKIYSYMVIFLASHFRLAQINFIVEIWKDKNFEKKII